MNPISYTTKSGMELEIIVLEFHGRPNIDIKSGGNFICSDHGCWLVKSLPPALKQSLPSFVTQDYYMIGRCLIDHATGQKVLQTMADLQAQIDQRPEQIMLKLRQERASLVDDINGALDEADSAKARSYESGEGTGQFIFAGKKWEDRADSARAKLNAFDKAHPEIIEAIKKEKAEDAERHFWD